MFSADSAFHAAALIHLDYCLVDQRSPFQKKKKEYPANEAGSFDPELSSPLLLHFSSFSPSWVHYHYYYPPTFFPFIWLPYFLSSSQPFSQNPPTATPELFHPLFHVLSSSSSSGLPPDRQLTADCPPNESEVATGRLAESVLLIYIEMSHIFPGYCG